MKTTIAIISILFLLICSSSCGTSRALPAADNIEAQIKQTLSQQIMDNASWAMKQQPVTITEETSPRSAGGKHDFFSESDYFWPDPKNPGGRYIEKDGLTNPDNFVAHRKAMIRFSKIIGALASAYKITGDDKYVEQALAHLKAWFIDTATLMNPHLQFAQAVRNHVTGRNYGIIDTIHFLEVVQGILVMQQSPLFDKPTLHALQDWFARYNHWLTTSKFGIAERNIKNNHSTCWTMQVAAFARLCGDETLLDTCRKIFKEVLVPRQMATDGSFPLELGRTKPYGYSIFNLDAMVTLCSILSTGKNNLWNFQTPDGRSIKKGIEYLYPFIANKSKWPLKPDVMYWNDWPVAQPFLFFGAQAFHRQQWLDTWKKLDHQPVVEEVIRNLPVRNPIIWL